MTTQEINNQIRSGKLDKETLLFVLKNIGAIECQSYAAINQEVKEAAKNVYQYVCCLLEMLPEQEAEIMRGLYKEKRRGVLFAIPCTFQKIRLLVIRTKQYSGCWI